MKIVLPDMLEKAKGTAEERLAFVEGAGFVINHIQEYAVELFLRGDHYSEVPAERLRDLANRLYLDLAKVVTEARRMEDQRKQDKRVERELMLVHPPESNPIGTFICPLCKSVFPDHTKECSMYVEVVSTKPPSPT